MLAAWMRMKFPNVVQAAVVTGAPILYFHDSPVPKTAYYHWIGKVYGAMGGIGDKCPELITEGFDQLRLLDDHPDTWPELVEKFKICCVD